MSTNGKKVVEVPSVLTVRDLANLVKISPINVIKELMNNGIMANINQQLDYDTAAIVLTELGFEPHEERRAEAEAAAESAAPATLWQRLYAGEDPRQLKPRPPVVTVMGHVDHGKTSLLDAMRHTDVASGEAGGITQRIGAYQIEHNGRKITFLDTPGHEAFTAMRARGAQATDLAILVVAADDGVMPQTKEAISHAKAAGVPLIVALNKIDKPNGNPERVKKELHDNGVTIDEYGGNVLLVPVSAKKKIGIDDLLEAILLLADSMEIKANPDRAAIGTVIESKLDRSRGPMATVLVQNGALSVGDALVIGRIFGRVRAMIDDNGRSIKKALPSTPVAIIGLSEVPNAGDMFEVVKDERTARALAGEHAEALTSVAPGADRSKVSLEDFFRKAQAEGTKELLLVIKADGQGSIEPLVNSLERLDLGEVKAKVLHTGIGRVSESDVQLATASDAIVIAFNVEVDEAARRMAESEGIDIRRYDVIYKLVEDIDKALRGMLQPVYQDKVIGRAEVRQVFKIKSVGVIAGCIVREGVLQRDAKAHVLRDGAVVHDGGIASLKRFTEDVKEVRQGFECGIGLANFKDFKEGDIVEFYVKERVS
ncbi:MAG TPA: translation initiation factor IF-2 [Anaerolineae bacterium]|nr:translation initiation factor IF-2 [Anaerolineae bacterium]